jgi:DNA polymerase III subunit beta
LGTGAAFVRVELGERQIRFMMEGGVAGSKLVDGRYPEYGRVIPAGLRKAATVDREALRRALVRASILSNEKFRGLRVSFEVGVLRLVANNPEQEEAVEEIELDYKGEPTAIGFNVLYLADLLGAIDSAKVEVHFEDGNSSSLWRGAGAGGEAYVVMPMRL